MHITSYYNSTEPFEVRVSDIAYARIMRYDVKAWEIVKFFVKIAVKFPFFGKTQKDNRTVHEKEFELLPFLQVFKKDRF